MPGRRLNLVLPGNPRYQPKPLIAHFGYDNLFGGVARIELALLDVLAEIGIIPAEDYALLTPQIRAEVIAIRTTAVDEVERKVTGHDIRAWIRLAQKKLPKPLRRWVHVLFTSYDALDSGRALTYVTAYREAIRPALVKLIGHWAALVREHAGTVQIGRTHGQHAMPITIGFWLGTILGRVTYCLKEMDRAADLLVGKITGAVGACNAQVGLKIRTKCGRASFERRVLAKVGLRPAKVSTQIVQPEPLACFLHAAVLMSGAIAQLGRDCRNLMRSEIGEAFEVYEPGRVGSSTMAGKENPAFFEQLEGFFFKQVAEYQKILLTLISEHQRDLVGSCVMRDFPIILVNLMQQVGSLLRSGKKDERPFIARIGINPGNCERNIAMSADRILAEPLYIALQMAGYAGDAHELVNQQALPLIKKNKGMTLLQAVEQIAIKKKRVRTALENIPKPIRQLLAQPEKYTGNAKQQSRRFAARALAV